MAEMNSVCIDRNGDINAVIDEKLCTELPGKFPEFMGQVKKITHGKILFTELDRPNAALERHPYRIRQRNLRLFPVGDEIEFKI